jgi:1-acyl-sn-glycerol-3-phosphate acyltransferase
MIPSHRWRPFARWFARRIAARMQRDFSRVMIHGLDEAHAVAREHPTLWVANHTSWWDPLVTVLLGVHVLRLDTFAMMASENLQRLPFFGLVGAFGVDRARRRDGADATRYAASLLDRPARAVWIFPQGNTRAPTEPLRFLPGAAAIHARAPGSVVLPIGLRYVCGDDPRPELWIAIGAPLYELPSGKAATALLEREVARCLALVDERTGTFSSLLSPRIAGDGLATRMLSGFANVIVGMFGRRLQAAIGADDQRVIGPADRPLQQRADERDEHDDIGEQRIDERSAG